MFTLIIGGSASGKSDYAERLVQSLGGNRIYIATMQPFGRDAQMRIARHRALRQGRGFETLECYMDLQDAPVPPGSNLLLEDLGNLVANEMFAENPFPAGPAPAKQVATDSAPASNPASFVADKVVGGIRALLGACAHLTLVTNDIFSDGDNYAPETLCYMQALAAANRILADMAGQVIEVCCGLPNCLKGPGRAVKKKSLANCTFSGGCKQYSSEDPVRREAGGMIFVIGPLHAGKQAFVQALLGWDAREFSERAARDVQDLAAKAVAGPLSDFAGGRTDAGEACTSSAGAIPSTDALERLADELAQKEVVIATELGGGVVPIDPQARQAREAAGRLACLLAARAHVVIRVCCGLPQVLKDLGPIDG